jgi:hypothetical protein
MAARDGQRDVQRLLGRHGVLFFELQRRRRLRIPRSEVPMRRGVQRVTWRL